MTRLSRCALVLLLCGPVQAQEFFTFSQWELLSPVARDAYVSGSVDAMLHYQNPSDALGAEITKRQSACLSRARITNSQITQGLLHLASQEPSFKSSKVQPAITEFISRLCPDLLGARAFIEMMDQLAPPLMGK